MSCALCWGDSAKNIVNVFDITTVNYSDQTGPTEGWATCRSCGAHYGWSCLPRDAESQWEYVFLPSENAPTPLDEGSVSALFIAARTESRPWLQIVEDLHIKGQIVHRQSVQTGLIPAAWWELVNRG